jgi:hypothetical protein
MSDSSITFAKQQLGANPKENECKLLGLKWNKIEDTLQVDFPTVPAVLTKRGVLTYLAKVYDPLGLISPMMLEGKIIYREICEEKIRWDEKRFDIVIHKVNILLCHKVPWDNIRHIYR